MFESYESWKQSHEVDVTLRCIYEAMSRCTNHHDTEAGEAWRKKPWYHHIRKAWFHLLPQFESDKDLALDTKIKEGSSPPTILPHAILSMTRLHFAVNHWATQGLLPFIPVAQPVVDVREEEQSGE